MRFGNYLPILELLRSLNLFTFIFLVTWGVIVERRSDMAGVWAPFKELERVVHSAISQKQPEAYYHLENILKKHKPDFVSLLQNPVSLLYTVGLFRGRNFVDFAFVPRKMTRNRN